MHTNFCVEHKSKSMFFSVYGLINKNCKKNKIFAAQFAFSGKVCKANFDASSSR